MPTSLLPAEPGHRTMHPRDALALSGANTGCHLASAPGGCPRQGGAGLSGVLPSLQHTGMYALVSRGMRRIAEGQDPLEGQKHRCGMGNMFDYHSTGYDDLDELQRTPQPLIFIMELFRVRGTARMAARAGTAGTGRSASPAGAGGGSLSVQT